MKNSLSNKLKFIKLLEEIHKLKVDTLDNSRYAPRVIDKIKLKEWKLNKERKKVGYLKHRAKIDFKVKKKLKEKFGDTFFSNMKKDIKDPILTNNKFLLNGLKKT